MRQLCEHRAGWKLNCIAKALLDWDNVATMALTAKYHSPFVWLLYAMWASDWQSTRCWIYPVEQICLLWQIAVVQNDGGLLPWTLKRKILWCSLTAHHGTYVCWGSQSSRSTQWRRVKLGQLDWFCQHEDTLPLVREASSVLRRKKVGEPHVFNHLIANAYEHTTHLPIQQSLGPTTTSYWGLNTWASSFFFFFF